MTPPMTDVNGDPVNTAAPVRGPSSMEARLAHGLTSDRSCSTSSAWLTAISFTDTVKNEIQAQQILEAAKQQIGYIGGRFLPDSPQKPARIQIFFDDEKGASGNDLSFAGLRRVLIPPAMAREFERKSGNIDRIEKPEPPLPKHS